MKCGLLGRKLRHSYSPAIHRQLGNYEYTLFEKEQHELMDFLRNGDFSGLNVTMPYKKTVIPFLDNLTETAQMLGAVNTITRHGDGRLLGHNSDFYGFSSLVERSALCPKGKKCLVLGSGGASATAVAVLKSLDAEVIVISRSGENNYTNLEKHADAAILVNATPVGMYPECGVSPVDLEQFPRLEGVLDVVYNPARTKLLMDAENRGIMAMNGLWMLVAQAKESAEYFSNAPIPPERIEQIHTALQKQMENIILIGMPGCGKSTIGRLLAEKMGKCFADADEKIVELARKSIANIMEEDGEAVFRNWETKALMDLGKQSGLVIATGGGCVTQERNYPLLHQNGTIFWLKRDISLLPTEGRPLSIATSPEELYLCRKPLYHRFADHIIDNNGTPMETVNAILEVWK